MGNAEEQEKHNFRVYTSSDPTEASFVPQMMRLAFESRAALAVVPLQDIFNLGSEDRMNLPGTTGDHNWTGATGPAICVPIWRRTCAR